MTLKLMALVAIASVGLAASTTLAQSEFHHPLANSPQSMPCMGTGQPMGMHSSMRAISEADYLAEMIPHHQEAIDTARIIAERSDRPEMREFAQQIITVQQAEIDQMQAWLTEWYGSDRPTVTYSPMMRDLTGLDSDALDQAFLEDMIGHHHHAVMMSHMLLNHNAIQHEAVRPFAEQIASTQQAEIAQMNTWLNDWFGTVGYRFHGGRETPHGGHHYMGRHMQ